MKGLLISYTEVEELVENAKLNGGATHWKLDRVKDGKSGYTVGFGDRGITAHSEKALNESLPTSYLQSIMNKWLEDEGVHGVGIWLDRESGVWYIDPVQNFQVLNNAMLAAKLTGEKAIWDVSNEREIRVCGISC